MLFWLFAFKHCNHLIFFSNIGTTENLLLKMSAMRFCELLVYCWRNTREQFRWVNKKIKQEIYTTGNELCYGNSIRLIWLCFGFVHCTYYSHDFSQPKVRERRQNKIFIEMKQRNLVTFWFVFNLVLKWVRILIDKFFCWVSKCLFLLLRYYLYYFLTDTFTFPHTHTVCIKVLQSAKFTDLQDLS